jgi:hypothetical protein
MTVTLARPGCAQGGAATLCWHGGLIYDPKDDNTYVVEFRTV